jgi:hypothetical protein
MSLTPTLYLTRDGLLEPLGQSQVMAYLRGLSRDYKITLITYEKPQDWANSEAMTRARADCQAHGIDWRPKNSAAAPDTLRLPGACSKCSGRPCKLRGVAW